MSALPHPLDVAAPQVEVQSRPLTLPRPAWTEGVARAGRIAAMCCLVLLVPGEAGRFGSGDLSRR